MKNEVMSNISDFIFGGNADFFIIQDTSNRGIAGVKYRYKVRKGRNKSVYLVQGGERGNLSYLGTISRARNAFFFKEAPSISDADRYVFKGLQWVLNRSENLPSAVHVVHNGRCAMCGRLLTDEESVLRGFGPTCAKKLGI